MNVQGKKTIENAVVGIVEMVSSAKLSNSVEALVEWEIKERFFQAAQVRAEQTGMLILNQTGDGLLLLANPQGQTSWARGLDDFQRLLVADFRAILREYAGELRGFESGLRFGVATGPVIIAQLGNGHYMAAGAAINLAARLCASAACDQMAMSAKAWETYRNVRGATADLQAYENLKGFDHVVLAFHVVNQNHSVVSERDADLAQSMMSMAA